MNKELREFLVGTKGIFHENSCTYTAEQNGKIERENRTVVESARTMLIEKFA